MPSVPILPRATTVSPPHTDTVLPQLLRTPAGLALLEIQGTVKFSQPSLSEQSDSEDKSTIVGKFVFADPEAEGDAAWQKRVHLYIGQHQRMTGDICKLQKPIAILRRRMNSNTEELEVAEIVYFKLLFAHRPEPVGGESAEEKLQ